MSHRPVHATVDLDAVRHNARVLADRVGGAALMAVVKADAYGHGAAPVARAALDAGAAWLGVALVEEGADLREAGIEAPILVLSEPLADAAPTVVAHRLTPVVYRAPWIGALAKAVADAGTDVPLGVHLKIDTGMHRAGCDYDDALVVADAIAGHPELELEGLMTHLAVADEPGHPVTPEQLIRFERCRRDLAGAGHRPALVHAANSAAAILLDEARYDLVRCGIALYGIPPAPQLEGSADLRPALSLHAEVTQVRRIGEGEGVSYGLRYRAPRPTTIAVVPIGYADGVPRRYGDVGGEVLVGGHRRPVAGAVTMDQLMVDCGDDDVAVEDPVVLIGDQGAESITATEWAQRLGTIGYEITCGIGDRVPRRYSES